jgi:hypothetical protein
MASGLDHGGALRAPSPANSGRDSPILRIAKQQADQGEPLACPLRWPFGASANLLQKTPPKTRPRADTSPPWRGRSPRLTRPSKNGPTTFHSWQGCSRLSSPARPTCTPLPSAIPWQLVWLNVSAPPCRRAYIRRPWKSTASCLK